MEARETVDTVTGELLESIHVLANPAKASDAGRRLDRVRDIEALVTLTETVGDARPSSSTSRSRTAAPNQTGR